METELIRSSVAKQQNKITIIYSHYASKHLPIKSGSMHAQ